MGKALAGLVTAAQKAQPPKQVEVPKPIPPPVVIQPTPVKPADPMFPPLNPTPQKYYRLRTVKKRPAWNERFFVEDVVNFTEAHPYFKKYFDKPSRRTPYNRFREMDLQFRGGVGGGSQVFYQGSPPRYSIANNGVTGRSGNRRQIPMYDSNGVQSDDYHQSSVNIARQGAKWASPSKNNLANDNVRSLSI